MSDEESENEQGEENEEKEDEEGEGEEEEGEEGEEEEDEEDDKKKKSKKGKNKDDNKQEGKFQEEKLVLSNEIKIELPNGNNNDFISMGNNPQAQKSIFSILSEINSDMDTLSTELNSTMNLIERRSSEREKEDLQELINKASQINKKIDYLELEDKQMENKMIQSDNEEELYQSQQKNEMYQPMHSSPQRQYNLPKISRRETYPPYDPNKNKEYYYSLQNKGNLNENIPMMQNMNMNMNNPYINSSQNLSRNQMFNNNNSSRFQTSRVKNMDELYHGVPFNNRLPVVYSQNEVNNSQNFQQGRERTYMNELNGSMQRQRFENMEQQPKPFERFRPGSISQAMDILLDKQ